MSDVTIGIDIGTTSVKGVAVDATGEVVHRVRIPHEIRVPAADRLEHVVDQAWRDGPRQAFDELAGSQAAAVAVSAMVPSLAAFDADGTGLSGGMIYGDSRGRVTDLDLPPMIPGEALGFLRWLAAEHPDAAAYWTAHAAANHALSGRAVMDAGSAAACWPLYEGTGWSAEHLEAAGVGADKLPEVVDLAAPAGRVGDDGPVLAGGLVDALGEQLVAGADEDGDVLVILGATLLTWAVVPEWVQTEGVWCIPHTAPGKFLVGGPSNAGGLFLDWVRRWVVADDTEAADDPHRVPVWQPYPRGERVPLHDPHRRGSIHGLALDQRSADVLRAAYEASGFVVRHHLDLAPVQPERLVVTGGGSKAAPWVQAICDATQLPADVVEISEGAARGAAFTARVAAGLEAELGDARRWARIGHRVEPDEAWVDPVAERYARFRELTAQAAVEPA